MKHSRFLSVLVVVCVFWVFLASCGAAQPSSDQSVEELVSTLASPAFEGRISGSTGNQKAAEYIAEYFKEQGLEPYFETFYQEYEGPVYRPEQAEPEVILTTAAGETISLKAGEDYFCSLPEMDLNRTLPVFTDPASCQDGAGIYFAPDRLTCLDWLAENPDSIAVFCDAVRDGEVTTISIRKETDRVLLILDQAFSDQLAEGAQLAIKIKASYSEGTLQNVAAVRRGSEGKSALIFSAHFDGSGIFGDQLFPSALDNASGTAAMMRIAALVQQQAPQLKNDLIFVTFNSEEAGMGGAIAFAKEVAAQYETVSLINIDCVGLKGETTYLMAEKRGQPLQEALSGLNFSDGIQASDETYTSDQIQFNGYNNCFPVVFGNVHTYLEPGNAHSPKDQAEQLDYPLIEELAAQLAGFAAEHGDDDFSPDPQQDSGFDFEQAMDAFWEETALLRAQLTQEYGLAYNQGLCVTLNPPQENGKTFESDYLLYGMQPFESLDEFAEQFPFVSLPEALSDEYTFYRAAIRLDHLAEEPVSHAAILDGPTATFTPGEIYEFEIVPEKTELVTAEYLAPDGSAVHLMLSVGRDFFTVEPTALGEDLDPALSGWEFLGLENDLYYAAKFRQGENVLLLLFEQTPGGESPDPTILSSGRMALLNMEEISSHLTQMDLAGLIQNLLSPFG